MTDEITDWMSIDFEMASVDDEVMGYEDNNQDDIVFMVENR